MEITILKKCLILLSSNKLVSFFKFNVQLSKPLIQKILRFNKIITDFEEEHTDLPWYDSCIAKSLLRVMLSLVFKDTVLLFYQAFDSICVYLKILFINICFLSFYMYTLLFPNVGFTIKNKIFHPYLSVCLCSDSTQYKMFLKKKREYN